MQDRDCPRFEHCNAAVCALQSVPTVMLGDEAVCFYLLCSGKAGAQERFAHDPVFAAVRQRQDELCQRHPAIARAIARASQRGFKGQNLRKRMAQPGSVPQDSPSAA